MAWLTDAEIPALVLLLFLTAFQTVMCWAVICDTRNYLMKVQELLEASRVTVVVHVPEEAFTEGKK